MQHREWTRGLFASLTAAAGVTDPQPLSIQLAMLYDGAMVGAHTEPQLPWALQARNAVTALLQATGVPGA